MKNVFRTIALFFCLFSLMFLMGCASLAQNSTESETDSSDNKNIDPESYLREGDTAAADGDFDKALAQYMIALEEDDSNAELYYKVGYIHQSEGRIELAERSFRQTLKISPDHVPALVSLGLIALRRENFQYAELVLNQVLELDVSNWRALNALGVLSDLKEEYSSAMEFYEKALAQKPDSIRVLNNYGYSLYMQGRWKEAAAYFKQVVDKAPKDTQGWSNLALVYLQTGDENMAKIAFQKVVNEHQALNNIGYFNILRNDMASAREKLNAATNIAPSYYALAYRNLASVDANESKPLEGTWSDEPAALSSAELPDRSLVSMHGQREQDEPGNNHANQGAGIRWFHSP